jgi:hypothetical protein
MPHSALWEPSPSPGTSTPSPKAPKPTTPPPHDPGKSVPAPHQPHTTRPYLTNQTYRENTGALVAQVTSTHRERTSPSAPRPGGAGRSVCQSKLPDGRVLLSLMDGEEAWSPRYTWHRRPDNVRVNYGTVSMGVWRSGSACRLQRQPGATFSSGGDQREQPFVQARTEYSRSSK